MAEVRRIRLLKFPYLVYQRVIKLMNPMAQLDISQCSKKMKNSVKHCFTTGNYSMHLSMLEFLLFSIYTPDQTVRSDFSISEADVRNPLDEDVTTFRRKIGKNHRVLCHLRDDEPVLDTFWADMVVGAKEIYKELIEVFGISLNSVEVDLDKFKDYATMLRWLNKVDVQSWVFTATSIPDSEFVYLIEHVVTQKSVKIDIRPSDGFKMSTAKVKIGHLKLQNSHWVTLKNLQTLKSVTIDLNNVVLTDEMMNKFLKELANPNLEYLKLRFEGILNVEKVLEGLETEKVGDKDVREYRKHGIQTDNKDAFNIRLGNGNVCSIGFKDSTEAGFQTMEIIVWKD
ncbi:unnamed protein product [Caenorhabditis brenneri]